MKIKTVFSTRPEKFDEEVNNYLAKGYRLNHCELKTHGNVIFAFYARLVLVEEDD